MMTEKYPTWLIGHVKEWAEKRLPTVILCSTTGNELLEVWYYGDLLTVKGEPQSYIIDSDEAPGLVTARDPESGEEFVIFDGGRHGYDNMFCDEHDPSELEHRPLKRYEIPASKLVLELGYSIDYEDEKENFEPDEADTVELINGERMPWEQAKRDGIDYIALLCERGRKTSPDTGRRAGLSIPQPDDGIKEGDSVIGTDEKPGGAPCGGHLLERQTKNTTQPGQRKVLSPFCGHRNYRIFGCMLSGRNRVYI